MYLASMGGMLNICHEPLPVSETVYIAFRLACCDTLERMVLAEQMDDPTETNFGYLTQVPFLRHVPPQVQLDLLVETWRKHTSSDQVTGDLVDESVIYAACETASQLVASDPATAARLISRGPVEIADRPSLRMSREIQAVHLDLANEGDFLLISQFQDIPTDEALLLKTKFGLDPAACEPMFDVLGRWHVGSDFARRAGGLLNSVEAARAVALFPGRRSSRPAGNC
jgi:hypothetical protein